MNQIEIRDREGNLIGYFTPADRKEAVLYQRAAAHFDPQEIKRRKDSGCVGLTTAEVLDRLQALEDGE